MKQRIFTRYVLAEFLKVFLVSLCALTALMMLVGVVMEARRQNLGLVPIVRLLPFLLPEALQLAIPGTMLFAVSSVFGRMAGANEMVALKSLGISPLAVLRPMLYLAAAISLVTIVLNDVAVSWGRAGAQRVIIESVEEIAYGMLRSQRSYSTGRFSINVKRVEGRRLIRPTVAFEATADKPAVTITADSAELRANLDENTLNIQFHNGTIHVGDSLVGQFPGMEQYEVPLADASRGADRSQKPSALTQWRLAAAIEQQERHIARFEQELAATAAYQLMSGAFEGLGDDDWRRHHRQLASERNHLVRLRLEPHRRWSDGLVCLCFALVGAPMAIRLRNADFLTSFFACFLPILLVYYPVLALSLERAKSGSWPPATVWLANVLLALWGTWLLRRVLRY